MIKIHPTEELVEEASGAQAHAAADEHIPEHVQLASSLARKPHVMLITGFCIIRIIEYDQKRSNSLDTFEISEINVFVKEKHLTK